MRSLSTFFLIILSFFVVSNLMMPIGHGASFSKCTTFYKITGEMCYDYFTGMFVGSYPVEGQMKVVLDPIDVETVSYDSWHYYIDSQAEIILVDEEDNGILIDRMKADGNYTPFFINFPNQGMQSMHTLTETVEAHYLGERYVNFNGQYIRTHHYCYTKAELHSIYRCEWYFEWDSGVLLRIFKSIDINLIRVQWIDYTVENTTIILTGTHPVTAFLTNQRANFFAAIGSVIIVILSFYFLIQKKVRRNELI